jgi:hypothetical protein
MMYGDGGSKVVYNVTIEFHVGNFPCRCLRTVTETTILGVSRVGAIFIPMRYVPILTSIAQ